VAAENQLANQGAVDGCLRTEVGASSSPPEERLTEGTQRGNFQAFYFTQYKRTDNPNILLCGPPPLAILHQEIVFPIPLRPIPARGQANIHYRVSIPCMWAEKNRGAARGVPTGLRRSNKTNLSYNASVAGTVIVPFTPWLMPAHRWWKSLCRLDGTSVSDTVASWPSVVQVSVGASECPGGRCIYHAISNDPGCGWYSGELIVERIGSLS